MNGQRGLMRSPRETDIVEDVTGKARADAVALVLRLDDGVGEGHAPGSNPVFGIGDDLTVAGYLPAPAIGMVRDLEIGH